MHETHLPGPAEPAGRSGADVAVIGAGLSGLAAAIDLARVGRSVVVYDARTEIGGRARTTERDGFLLNEGPHALYRTGAAHRFLVREGLEPAGGEPRADRAVGVAADLMGPLPADARSLLRTPLLKGERIRFARLFAGLGRLDTAALDDVTVDDGVRRLLGDGRGAAVLRSLLRVATYGNDPSVMSAGVAIAQLRESLNTPVRYVDGGWAVIVDSLTRRLEELGGQVVSGAKVRAVNERTDGVEVVTDSGSTSAAAVVIAAGGPAAVEALCGVNPAPFARPSTVASLDVGLRTGWGGQPTFAVGLDEPLYLSVHAPVARLGPDGHSLVGVMRYHPFGDTVDADHDRVVMEALLDQVRPGWRDDAVHVGFRARMVATHDQPQAARGALAGRAPVTVAGHQRVVVAGDWVGNDGLLADACFASAVTAAASIAERIPVTA